MNQIKTSCANCKFCYGARCFYDDSCSGVTKWSNEYNGFVPISCIKEETAPSGPDMTEEKLKKTLEPIIREQTKKSFVQGANVATTNIKVAIDTLKEKFKDDPKVTIILNELHSYCDALIEGYSNF